MSHPMKNTTVVRNAKNAIRHVHRATWRPPGTVMSETTTGQHANPASNKVALLRAGHVIASSSSRLQAFHRWHMIQRLHQLAWKQSTQKGCTAPQHSVKKTHARRPRDNTLRRTCTSSAFGKKAAPADTTRASDACPNAPNTMAGVDSTIITWRHIVSGFGAGFDAVLEATLASRKGTCASGSLLVGGVFFSCASTVPAAGFWLVHDAHGENTTAESCRHHAAPRTSCARS